jgi:Predicted ring-cleavage extradiol dioxygenase
MKLGFVTVHVKDLDRSFAFYTKILSLKEVRRINAPNGPRIVFLSDNEGGLVELLQNAEDNEKSGGRVSLGFPISSMEDTVKMLADKGIGDMKGPVVLPNGEKLLFIKDPDGVEIEFIEGFKM